MTTFILLLLLTLSVIHHVQSTIHVPGVGIIDDMSLSNKPNRQQKARPSNDNRQVIKFSDLDNACDGTKALIIKANIDMTMYCKVQYFQTTMHGQTVRADPVTIYVQVLAGIDTFLLPLNAFKLAVYGYAIVFWDLPQISNVAVLDISATYKMDLLTVNYLLYDPYVTSEPPHNIFLRTIYNNRIVLDKDETHGLFLAQDPEQCLDISNKHIRITYSSTSTSQCKLKLEHKQFICESPMTKVVNAYIMFASGTQVQVHIPNTAFNGANLQLGYYLTIYGPLVIHQIDIVDAHIRSPAIQGLPSTRDRDLVPLQPTTTPRVSPKAGFDQLLDQLSQQDTWAEFKFSKPKDLDISTSTETFLIKYTAISNGYWSFTPMLVSHRNPHSKSYVCTTYDTFEIKSVVFAGQISQMMIPVSSFVSSTNALETVCGLAVKGDFTVHAVSILNYKLPRDEARTQPVHSETLVGPPRLIEDFSPETQNQVDKLFKVSDNSQVMAGMAFLGSRNAYIIHRFDVWVTDEENAFRLTYTSFAKGPRLIQYCTESDFRNNNIEFQDGRNMQIVIPFSAFGPRLNFQWVFDSEAIAALIIHGPLIVHKVELVTTQDEAPNWAVLGKLPISVHRNNVFDDLKNRVMSFTPKECRMALSVMFHKEEGIDEGGVIQELFSLVSKEIVNPTRGLFVATPEGKCVYEVDPLSSRFDGYLNDFRFVGRVIGLAISNERLLNVDFAISIYKTILGEDKSMFDLQSVDPVLYKNLNMLRDLDVSDLGLEYDATSKEASQSIKVTNENKNEYIKNYWHRRMYGAVQTQMHAIRQGVLDIVPEKWLLQIKAVVLMRSVHGTSAALNLVDWQKHTRLDGYRHEDVTVQLFWECVTQYTDAERRMLLQFVTGSTRVPFHGFGTLSYPFTIKNAGLTNLMKLPATHTCINTIDLPPYTTLQVMQDKLKYAMTEGYTFTIS